MTHVDYRFAKRNPFIIYHLSPLFLFFLTFYFLSEKKTKIVALVRNPKDVCVSLYHLDRGLKWIDYQGTFEDYLQLFMKGQSRSFTSKHRQSKTLINAIDEQFKYCIFVLGYSISDYSFVINQNLRKLILAPLLFSLLISNIISAAYVKSKLVGFLNTGKTT